MAPSAIFGQPPASEEDFLILKGFAISMGIPPDKIQRDKGIPVPVKPHGSNPYADHSTNMIAALSVAVALMIAITSLRIWLRLFRRDLKAGLDDLFIIIATVMCCVWIGLQIAMAKVGGGGKHLYAVTYQQFYWYFHLAGIGQIIFWPTVGLINVSITLFNRRLTGLTSRRWQFAHFTFLTLLAVYIITSFFMNLFICLPVGINLSYIQVATSTKPAKCLNYSDVGITFAALHIAFQFSLLLVPLVVLYVINMSLAKKIRLAFLFSIGSVACIGAVMLQVLNEQHDPDVTFRFQKKVSWAVVDLFFTLLAASLPVLNAVLPARWRNSPNATPPLGNLAVLRRSRVRDSVRIESNETITRPDGTVDDRHGDPEHGLVNKDSFTRKTEKRWDEAFEHAHQGGQDEIESEK